MANASRNSMAGGFLLAVSILVGAFVGIVKQQASLGLVVGLSVGIVLAIVIWLVDRRRA